MTSLRLLHVGGAAVPVSFALSFIALVTRLPDDLKQRAVQLLWSEVLSAAEADAASLHAGSNGAAPAISSAVV